MPTWLERLLGLLLVVAAVVWAAYHLAAVRQFQAAFLRLGPMQLLMGGLLLWLHGRYRAVHLTGIQRH